MKIAEFEQLFKEIESLIRNKQYDEAIEKLNIMGEELLKAESSMDKFRDRVKAKRAELKKTLIDIRTGAPIGNERPQALAFSLAMYRKKWDKMNRERLQLKAEYENIDEQITYLKAGKIPDHMLQNLWDMASGPKTKRVIGPSNPGFYNI